MHHQQLKLGTFMAGTCAYWTADSVDNNPWNTIFLSRNGCFCFSCFSVLEVRFVWSMCLYRLECNDSYLAAVKWNQAFTAQESLKIQNYINRKSLTIPTPLKNHGCWPWANSGNSRDIWRMGELMDPCHPRSKKSLISHLDLGFSWWLDGLVLVMSCINKNERHDLPRLGLGCVKLPVSEKVWVDVIGVLIIELSWIFSQFDQNVDFQTFSPACFTQLNIFSGTGGSTGWICWNIRGSMPHTTAGHARARQAPKQCGKRCGAKWGFKTIQQTREFQDLKFPWVFDLQVSGPKICSALLLSMFVSQSQVSATSCVNEPVPTELGVKFQPSVWGPSVLGVDGPTVLGRFRWAFLVVLPAYTCIFGWFLYIFGCSTCMINTVLKEACNLHCCPGLLLVTSVESPPDGRGGSAAARRHTPGGQWSQDDPTSLRRKECCTGSCIRVRTVGGLRFFLFFSAAGIPNRKYTWAHWQFSGCLSWRSGMPVPDRGCALGFIRSFLGRAAADEQEDQHHQEEQRPWWHGLRWSLTPPSLTSSCTALESERRHAEELKGFFIP